MFRPWLDHPSLVDIVQGSWFSFIYSCSHHRALTDWFPSFVQPKPLTSGPISLQLYCPSLYLWSRCNVGPIAAPRYADKTLRHVKPSGRVALRCPRVRRRPAALIEEDNKRKPKQLTRFTGDPGGPVPERPVATFFPRSRSRGGKRRFPAAEMDGCAKTPRNCTLA